MATIIFNAKGVPLLASGRSYMDATTEFPADKPQRIYSESRIFF